MLYKNHSWSMQVDRTLNHAHDSSYAGNNWLPINPSLTCQNSKTVFDDPSDINQFR